MKVAALALGAVADGRKPIAYLELAGAEKTRMWYSKACS
jgi:hypothetical protein